MDIFKPDIYELQEIETYDIPIDFNQNMCIKCKKKFQIMIQCITVINVKKNIVPNVS